MVWSRMWRMNETDARGPLHPSLCNISLLISGLSSRKSHLLYRNHLQYLETCDNARESAQHIASYTRGI